MPTGVVKDSWDVHRMTALMFAVFNGHAGIVQLILPGSADKDLQDFMARHASSSATPWLFFEPWWTRALVWELGCESRQPLSACVSLHRL